MDDLRVHPWIGHLQIKLLGCSHPILEYVGPMPLYVKSMTNNDNKLSAKNIRKSLKDNAFRPGKLNKNLQLTSESTASWPQTTQV